MRKFFDKMWQFGIVDHQKVTKDSITVEPYVSIMEDFEQLIGFCRENGLDFFVTGDSHHAPGRTFRVRIFKKEDRDKIIFDP